MYDVSTQCIDERMINVHYYYYKTEWGATTDRELNQVSHTHAHTQSSINCLKK